jgi:hypothetical protein
MRESTSRNQANGLTPHRLQEAMKLRNLHREVAKTSLCNRMSGHVSVWMELCAPSLASHQGEETAHEIERSGAHDQSQEVQLRSAPQTCALHNLPQTTRTCAASILTCAKAENALALARLHESGPS